METLFAISAIALGVFLGAAASFGFLYFIMKTGNWGPRF